MSNLKCMYYPYIYYNYYFPNPGAYKFKWIYQFVKSKCSLVAMYECTRVNMLPNWLLTIPNKLSISNLKHEIFSRVL